MRRVMLFSLLIGALSCGEEPSNAIDDAVADADVAADATADGAGLDDSTVDGDGGARDAGADLVATSDTGRIDGADVPTDEPDSSPRPDTADVPTLSDFEACFGAITQTDEPSPNYDQFEPVVGSHCYGTNHQDIVGVERVVFVGDSVTVGTPPTLSADYYRSRLADSLAQHFDLDAPDFLWKTLNLIDGTSLIRDSGDFASCAKWGARADDLMEDNSQLEDCLPQDQRDQRTLVVMTMGGNDLASITQGFVDGQSIESLWAETETFMARFREAIEWLTEPGRFPNGVYVVFTNLYEFTDATGDVTSCPAAGLGGLTSDIDDPALPQMVVWAMEEYMSIAADTGTDMLFLLETFCGHGFNRDDPAGRCYLGEDAEPWFDLTCIHPNPAGHEQIADMFMAVVEE